MEDSLDDDTPIRDYRDLKVWTHAMDLAAEIYSVTKTFPREEQFGMTAQMRRSAASVPANIAEGFGRGKRGSFINFLRIAQGSLKELETHTQLSSRVGLMEANAVKRIERRCEELGKMVRAFIRSLERGGENR